MRQIIRLILMWLAVSPLLLAADYRFVKIHFPKSVLTDARGINARGDIVGSYVDANEVSHAFLLHKGVFTSIDVPNAVVTLGARAINARGDIVGSFVGEDSGQHGYLLRDGEFTQIDYPEARATFAFGINNAGDITGSHFDMIGSESESGFILKDGAFHNEHIRGSRSTSIYSAQDNGRVWVGQTEQRSDHAFHGFVRNKQGDVKLIDFPGLSVPCTGARWVNQRRDIVGFFSYVEKAEECGELPSHGFLLRNRRYQKIDFPGSAETKVLAINDDGVIVGNFTDSQGNTHGFKAVPKD